MKKLVLLLGVVLAMGFASCEKQDPAAVAKCYEVSATWTENGESKSHKEQSWTNEYGVQQTMSVFYSYAQIAGFRNPQITYQALNSTRENCGEQPAEGSKCYKVTLNIKVPLAEKTTSSSQYIYNTKENVEKAAEMSRSITQAITSATAGIPVIVTAVVEEVSINDRFACEDKNPLPTSKDMPQ